MSHTIERRSLLHRKQLSHVIESRMSSHAIKFSQSEIQNTKLEMRSQKTAFECHKSKQRFNCFLKMSEVEQSDIKSISLEWVRVSKLRTPFTVNQ